MLPREKAMVGATGALVVWGAILGGGLVKSALLGAIFTTIGVVWLCGYSNRTVEFIRTHRSWFDWCVSLPLFFAPLVLGAHLGFVVVFSNLFITSALILLSPGGQLKEDVIEVIDAQVSPA